MSTDSAARLRAEIAPVVAATLRLADVNPSIVAVALVGSWARGAAHPGSDVDLVLLTTAPGELLGTDNWFSAIDPRARLIRAEDFGAIQERRLRLPSGLEIEVGIGEPSWAGTTPVDPGTRRVVDDGLAILHDPQSLLARLTSVVASDQ
jgi:predicted nucleotidyltransferase